VLIVALVFAAGQAGSRTTNNVTLPGTGSQDATDLLSERFPSQAYGSNPLVVATDSGKLTDSKYSKAIDSSVKALKKTPHVTAAVSPLSTAGASALSKDKQIGYISVALNVGQGELTEDEANAVLDAADPAKAAGLQVAIGGYVGQQLSKPDTGASDKIGIVAAMVILLLVFGSAVAMGLPILTAVLGLLCGLSVVTLLSHLTDVPTTAPTLATMIKLSTCSAIERPVTASRIIASSTVFVLEYCHLPGAPGRKYRLCCSPQRASTPSDRSASGRLRTAWANRSDSLKSKRPLVWLSSSRRSTPSSLAR
jgi:putative drug exporter of the RND superfamily